MEYLRLLRKRMNTLPGPSQDPLALLSRELEEKRKQRAQVTCERKMQLNKLRKKAEIVAEGQLGAQIYILNPIKY